MTVLFVDDEEVIRRMVSTMAGMFGMPVALASNGREALALCASRADISLVVTDIVMPEMDGVELAKELRVKHPELPLFAISGGYFEHQPEEVETLFDQIFYKPSDFSKMIAESLKLLSKKKCAALE